MQEEAIEFRAVFDRSVTQHGMSVRGEIAEQLEIFRKEVFSPAVEEERLS